MSYARFGGGSDVYVFASVGGWLECCGCALHPVSQRFDSTAAMLAHLDEHEAAGHGVPAGTRTDLLRDATENDDWIAAERARQTLQAADRRSACCGGEVLQYSPGVGGVCAKCGEYGNTVAAPTEDGPMQFHDPT